MHTPGKFAPWLLAALLVAGCQNRPQLPGGEASISPKARNTLADTNTRLGIGYLREGQLELAWKRLSLALEEDPDFSTAHNAMGLLYERLNDPQKAEEHFKKAVRFSPNDSASQTNFGSFLCRQGKYEQGEKRFLQALKNPLYATPELAYANAGLCMKKPCRLTPGYRRHY